MAAPRSWVETVYPGLAYFNEVDRGGHFAAWEEPELFAAELRAAFKAASVARRPAAGATDWSAAVEHWDRSVTEHGTSVASMDESIDRS